MDSPGARSAPLRDEAPSSYSAGPLICVPLVRGDPNRTAWWPGRLRLRCEPALQRGHRAEEMGRNGDRQRISVRVEAWVETHGEMHSQSPFARPPPVAQVCSLRPTGARRPFGGTRGVRKLESLRHRRGASPLQIVGSDTHLGGGTGGEDRRGGPADVDGGGD